MDTLLNALFKPERSCRCGHHEGSHCHGFSNKACMWCDCRLFAADTDTHPDSGISSARRPAPASGSVR